MKRYFKKVDINKVNKLIDVRIGNGKYIERSDTAHTELKQFPDDFYINFKNKEYYGNMCPVSNLRTCFFATAKTHKFKTIEEINVLNSSFV